MMNPPKTRAEAEKRWYGVLPHERNFNPDQCAYECRQLGRWPKYSQCSREPGHGPNALYCWAHAKMVEGRE